jgi:uncharacterized linocin/CFP29 family protein
MKKKLVTNAEMDAVYRGQGHGSVAARLLANQMNPGALRTNAVLRKDEWKHLDEAVVDISRQRLVGVNDLVSRGLVYNITNGLGTTVLEYETQTDMEPAEITMDGSSPGTNDRVEFDLAYLPLPITHRSFQLNIRALEASRKLGQSLDVTQAMVAARKVAEMVETTLFTGAGALTFGGGTLRGYLDHPNRQTVTLAANWDASASTGATILADVIALKQASIDVNRFGPWILYVPTAYETVLDDDFKANSDLTIRQRLLEIAGIEDVKVVDYLTANNVLLVELQPETVRMVIGMQPTTIEWESLGGMIHHFKVMSIMVPQIRADADGNCGIVHLSA